MSADNFPQCLAVVLQFEGGWWPGDAGDPNPTMKGVTLKTFQSYYPGSTADDLRNITEEQLQAIYRPGYWAPVKGDELPAGVDLCVFDFAVNAGPSRAARMLQNAVGASPDGIIGPGTLVAVSGVPTASLIPSYCEARRAYYRSLSTFDEFGDGWLKRVDECEAQALAMAL